VFSTGGDILGQSAREYPILSPHVGWAEQDAEQVWQLALEALGEAVTVARHDWPSGSAPVALALSVQGEAVVPVDEEGRPLRPAILGMDTRTEVENEWLRENLGAEVLFRRTGMPVHTINTLPKLLWLQRHEREIWRRAHQFLLYEDFFLRRLGERATISHCLACIEVERLASLAPEGGGVVGTLRGHVARELGLSHPLRLVSGGHDQACAALGSGVVRPGLAMVSTGTAEVVEVAMARPALNSALRNGNISVYHHVVPGLFLAMTLNHSGGLLLRWFRDAICPDCRDQAIAQGQEPYDLILDDAPPGPTELLVLPHFAGSGTPYLDTSSRGAILGLTFSTTRFALAKAILEGLTFELRVNTDLIREAGVTISELHAVGGGARSPLWLQLKADICRLPLIVPEVTEAACLGAALLAGVAAGVYPDLSGAVAQTVRVQRRVEPHPGSMSAYEVRYNLYRQMYPTLIGLQRQL
jgi:xylulokinase